MNFFQQNLDFTFKNKAICEKYLFFFSFEKKTRWPKAEGGPM